MPLRARRHFRFNRGCIDGLNLEIGAFLGFESFHSIFTQSVGARNYLQVGCPKLYRRATLDCNHWAPLMPPRIYLHIRSLQYTTLCTIGAQ